MTHILYKITKKKGMGAEIFGEKCKTEWKKCNSCTQENPKPCYNVSAGKIVTVFVYHEPYPGKEFSDEECTNIRLNVINKI